MKDACRVCLGSLPCKYEHDQRTADQIRRAIVEQEQKRKDENGQLDNKETAANSKRA